MEIVAFEPEMAEGVARCYNELITSVPECYPVPVERFATIEALAAEKRGRVRDEQLMVARSEDGGVAGFVHVGIAAPTKHDSFMKDDAPAIRFLAYRPGERAVGQALIGWAEDWAAEGGFDQIFAWVCGWRYRFYHFPCAHLSQHMGHVRALFGMNGYEVVDVEHYLTWRHFPAVEAGRPAFEFDLKVSDTQGRLGLCLEVKATAGEEVLGVCRMERGQASPGPESEAWCFCDNLWVIDRVQGKRLGRYLLATALNEVRRTGCKHAAISTEGSNYRAQLMYTNMGYQMTDCTLAFRKELSRAS